MVRRVPKVEQAKEIDLRAFPAMALPIQVNL